jgi:hypothetical protein
MRNSTTDLLVSTHQYAPVLWKYWDEFWQGWEVYVAGWIVDEVYYPDAQYSPSSPMPAEELRPWSKEHGGYVW